MIRNIIIKPEVDVIKEEQKFDDELQKKWDRIAATPQQRPNDDTDKKAPSLDSSKLTDEEAQEVTRHVSSDEFKNVQQRIKERDADIQNNTMPDIINENRENRKASKEGFKKQIEIGKSLAKANGHEVKTFRQKLHEFESQALQNSTGTQMSTLPETMPESGTPVVDIYDGSTPYFEIPIGEQPETIGTNGHDRVNHPDYYNLEDGPYLIHNGEKIPIECIDVIRNMPTWKGNVIKYLWRCGEKQEEGLSSVQKEFEDMQKADWYLDDKIEEMKRILNK